MKSNINKTFAVILAVMVFMPAFTFAEPTVTGGASAGVTTPSVTNQGSAATTVTSPAITNQGSATVTSNTPAVTNQGSAAETASTPVVTNQGSAEVTVSTPTVTNQGSAAVTASTPTVTNQGSASETSNTPTVTNQGSAAVTGTPATNTGGPSSNTGPSNVPSSTSTGTGISRNTGNINLPVLIGKCSYLNSYLKMGDVNDAVEVRKLQTFLKTTEGLNVDINGTFDQKTFDAVEAFQTKYVKDTMLPWGVTTPTGHVFYTTKNKINEIYCKTTFTLNAEQLATIEAYKAGMLNGNITKNSDTTTSVGNTTDSSSTTTVGVTDHGQTASASGTSVTSRIWGFIKWLFGY